MPLVEVITSMPINRQDDFLEYLISNCIKTNVDARKAKSRFLNNTIYTIGYEGRDLDTFIQTLKDNGIKQVIDIRYSNECSDPHFCSKFFTEQLS